MTRHHVWDPLVRVFHWTTVTIFAANALITDPEAKLHLWLGYTLAALLAVRLLWGFVGPLTARFSHFLPTPQGVTQQLSDMATGRKRAHLGHTPLGALMIFNLVASLIGICITGYMMGTDAYFGIDWVEKAHEALVTWAEISVVIHVSAVIWESRRTGVNLPRAMVTGVKNIPEGLQIEP